MNSGFRISSLLLVLALTSCSNSKFKVTKSHADTRRQIAQDYSVDPLSVMDQNYYEELSKEAQAKGHQLEFPPGFDDDDKTLMWHMSEGSEVFPTMWLLNMRSAQSSEPNSMFMDNLDKKFGLIKDYLPSKSGYPIKWVGVTAAWSDEHPEKQDIILEGNERFEDLPRVRKLPNGKQSIAMTGVNCTFCHTAAVGHVDQNGKMQKAVIEGAPAMIDARAFFRDMFASTLKTMANEQAAIEFLGRLKIPNHEEKAIKFSDEFRTAMGLQPTFKSELIKMLETWIIIGDKVTAKKNKEVPYILYEKRDVIYEYMVKFLKLTYGFDKVPPVLELRMRYFANLGTPIPTLEETLSAYGRTDAFGRISNAVARDINPIQLTAPVSMPYMYGIKYKSMFHYNANTNSVIARNIGQSFGLGAILTNPGAKGVEKFESTSNLHNLITMEKILYKAKVPEYQEIFPSAKVDKNLAVKGCNVYLNKCMNCHDAEAGRVGPQKALIQYKVIPDKVVGTDPHYLKNQSTPIGGKPFRKGLFDFTDGVKEWYFKKYDINDEEVKLWANQHLRGTEIFRDTILGEKRFKDDPDMNYVTIEPGRGFAAKNLAGIWATAPYLHNGSVPNIYELLLPSSKRTKMFIVGSTVLDMKNMGFQSSVKSHPNYREYPETTIEELCQYDVSHCIDTTLRGNSNKGHEPSMYGGELKNEDKYALIEYLKVVRPESEYAWTSTPIYKIENGKCELR